MGFYKELPRRGDGAAAGGPISGQFEGAAAEATEGGTYLLAKSSTVINAAQVVGDTPPELPGRSVRLKSAERFEAATGAVVVQGGNRALLPVTGFNISACILKNNGVSVEGGLVWPSNLATFVSTNAFSWSDIKEEFS